MNRLLVAAATLLILTSGCSGSGAPSAPGPEPAATDSSFPQPAVTTEPAAAAPAARLGSTCALLTGDQLTALLNGAAPTTVNDQNSGGTTGCIFQADGGRAGSIAAYCDPGQGEAILGQLEKAGGLAPLGAEPDRFVATNNPGHGFVLKRSNSKSCLIQVMATPSFDDQEQLGAALKTAYDNLQLD